MDLFKAQFEKIQRQLSGLSASQKMLTATLVAIMVMTLIWWGKYAGEPEMEPLLTQSVATGEELASAHNALEAGGIKSTLSGSQLLVPADQKLHAYSVLAYSKALPHNAKDSFEDILKSINPLQSQDTTNQMWNHGRELMAGQIIRRFRGVSYASVNIDPHRETRIGGSIEPTAGASVETDDHLGENAPQALVEAIADVLQSSLAGMLRQNIKVIIDGVSKTVLANDSDSAIAGDLQKRAHHEEDVLTKKVQTQLGYIRGAIATVTVQPTITRTDERSTKYDGKGAVAKETENRTSTIETAGGASGGEPGALPNSSFNGNAPAAAAGPTSTKETNETKLANYVPETRTEIHTPAGMMTVVAASVRVPLSFFAGRYVREHPSVKDPTEAMMKDMIEEERPKIRADVVGATGIPLESKMISVETYMDPPPTLAAAPAVATASIPMRLLTSNHIKEGILGVIALASLFMVSSLVKKGTPISLAAPSPVPAMAGAPMTHLHANEDMAGEVSAADPSLDAMEMDEDSIRAQQMMDQVSTMVKDNPDNAASLVKRWLNRT